jgi:hypothetical protein
MDLHGDNGVTYFQMRTTGYCVGATAACDRDGRKAVVVFYGRSFGKRDGALLAIVNEPWSPASAPFSVYAGGSPLCASSGAQLRFDSLAAAAKFCGF